MPLVSAIYAALGSLYIVGLGYWVVSLRNTENVGFGLGDSQKLARAVRIHGNAVENICPAVVLLMFAELQGAQALWIHVGGVTLLASRGLHAYGLHGSQGRSFGRFWGTGLTWGSIAGLAVFNLVLALR